MTLVPLFQFVALFLCSWLPDSYSLQFPISQSQLKNSQNPINESHVLHSLLHLQLLILLSPFLALEEGHHHHHLLLSKRNSSNPRVQSEPMIPKPLLLLLLSLFSSLVAPVVLVGYFFLFFSAAYDVTSTCLWTCVLSASMWVTECLCCTKHVWFELKVNMLLLCLFVFNLIGFSECAFMLVVYIAMECSYCDCGNASGC